jgi:hypothetical protein
MANCNSGAKEVYPFAVGDKVFPILFHEGATIKLILYNWEVYYMGEIFPCFKKTLYLIEFDNLITCALPKDALWGYFNEALQPQEKYDPSVSTLKFQMLKVGDKVRTRIAMQQAVVKEILRSDEWQIYDTEKQTLVQAETSNIYLVKFIDPIAKEFSPDTLWAYSDEQLVKVD